jgi:lysophospholipase L1-like esterase
VEIVTLTIPPALTFDGHHLTALGARRLAEALP